MKKLVIIDGKSVFYRGYYAMGNLSKSDGTPTGGVYGFAVIALEIVREIQPTKVVVAWDKAKTSVRKRKEIYPEYKAGRVKPPEDFFVQIPLLQKLVKALGWGFLECDDYEADDIIGTLAHQASVATALADARLAQRTQSTSHSGAPVALYQSDTDALEDQIWDTVIVSSDLDMLQVVDDNTRMYRLLKGFSKLEEMDVLAVEEKYGIKKNQFLDLKALKGDTSDNIPGVPGVGEKTAVKLLNEYGTLEGVYEHIDEITGAVQKKLIAGKDSAFMSYKLGKIYTDAPVSLDDIPDLVINPGRIERAFANLEFNSLKSKFKAEMTKLRASKLTDFKISDEKTDDDFAEKEARAEDLAKSDKITTPAIDFSDYIIAEDVKKKMHGNKDIAEQILGGKKFWDLAQARFLLNPLVRATMDEQSQGAFDFGDNETERQKKIVEANEQLVQMSQYPKLGEIYLHYDLPLIPVLYKMEKMGIKISQEYFAELLAEYKAQVDKLESEVFELAGVEFNVNSPVQLAQVLFEKLQLPTKGIKKTARGYSTGAKELEKLKDLHPIIPKLMEYREASKLLSTYIMPLPGLADMEGRIHTTFTQNVTATGRLSSVSPNLQNIPVRSEEGRRIRTGFVAGEGKKLVSADYSQFELRLAAVLSGDQALIADFNSGIDIHTKTASDVFQVPMKDVTKAQRRAAKTINFGVMYGMSAKGLADATGMTVSEAKRFIDDYFAVRKPIREYLNKVLKQAREEGYVETYYGRRRPTPDVKSANFMIRQGAERAAQNMPIQGTEADLMKRAMIRVDTKLPEGASLILQVHDSMIVECEEEQVEEVSKLLQEEMEGIAPELPIKLAVEVTAGDNWGEL
ncbi:DNA polymerase I [Candidatus Saccharibacteria bacterium]|nr:DNA polymerase I [Candidatus Saccharibacteria bacterium]